MRPPVRNPAWSPEVQALYRHDMQEMWDRSLAPHVWSQYHNQLDVYLAFGKGQARRVLDVGCAQGTLALLLAEQGHDVTAVDLRPEFLEYARARHESGTVRFVQANVLEDELSGTYDLIFANQIIEHLVYPNELLARLTKLLAPNGRLVVTTPSFHYFKNTLPSYQQLGNPAQWEHLQFTADGDGHFYAYTEQELLGVFHATGFREVQARFFETPWISGHFKVRHLHGVVPHAWLAVMDRLALRTPWLGKRLAHQLLVTGLRP